MTVLAHPADAGHQLSPHHVTYLEQRGVPAPFASKAGLRSGDAAAVQHILGLKNPAHSGGLVIPYGYRAGVHAYFRVRYDEQREDGARFGVPAGIEVPIYIANESVFDATAPLFVSEGPIKALAIAHLGYASVGLGGVATTITKDGSGRPMLGESWRAVPLKSRTVFIVFDAGTVWNLKVASSENNLGRALVSAGADVKVVRVPARETALELRSAGGAP